MKNHYQILNDLYKGLNLNAVVDFYILMLATEFST